MRNQKLRLKDFLLENKNEFKFIILRYFNVAGADKNYDLGKYLKDLHI